MERKRRMLKGFNRFSLMALVLGLCLLMSAPNALAAKQPESSYWYPEQLLEWSSDKDPDSKYNRSRVPLAKRVGAADGKEAKVVALSALNANTSGVPSQGGKEFFSNTFSYWQYVDLMVYWAGSAGEGIVVPPSADVIDAAHKNGVPILGTIFFPPAEYGGKFEWVDQMLSQNEDGAFPAADKLLEVASYYGFDGWFINQETQGGTEKDAKRMKDFLIYLQQKKAEGMHIMWYDSMIDNGQIKWQNALTEKNSSYLQDGNTVVADSMFLNFWWKDQTASNQKAKEIGRSPFDLYAGIDVEANGTATPVPWQGIFPEGQAPLTSLGIYRPDWAFKSSETMEEYYQKEKEFWLGVENQSGSESSPAWEGIAKYFSAKSSVQELPFVTHFNTGSGKFFAVNGEVMSGREWNNRSLQDILPTWRSNENGLSADFDWETAYYGGSSLKLSGSVQAGKPAQVPLYKANLPVQKDTEISVTYKTDLKKPDFKLGVSFADNPEQTTYFDMKKQSRGQWITDDAKLNKFSGKTIDSISLLIESDENLPDYEINIGEIKVSNKHDEKKSSMSAVKAKVEEVTFRKGIYGDLALSWQPAERDVSHYEVYRLLPGNKREYLGSTTNQVYFLSDLKRIGEENRTELEIVAVSKGFERSKPEKLSFEWPPYPKPEADFRSDKTVAAPGETIRFSDASSEVTETVTWTFEGGTPAESSDRNPTVTYDHEGTYAVTLVAKNSAGESTVTKKAFITITKDAKNITNLAQGKTATASGQCAPTEGAGAAVDGKVTDNSKWCALGDAPHWLMVDLGEPYTLSKFTLHHAQAGGEPQAFNTRAFRVELSTDGETWTEAVNVSDNAQGVSEHSITLEQAQYVRLWVDKPTQGGDQAARIYEFEVFGF